MSITTEIRVAAGWYPDPVEIEIASMPTHRRWWDGTAWTHHTAPLQTPVSPDISPETVAAVTAATQATAVSPPARVPSAVFAITNSAPTTVSPRESARAAERMPLHPVDPNASLRAQDAASRRSTVSAMNPAIAEPAGYVPFSHRARVEAHRAVSASSRSRNPHGLRVHTASVWLMAIMPVTQALLVVTVFSTLPAESSAWTRALAVAFPFVLAAALAGQDTRLMELSGHLRTAPWVTALLALPIYLAVRGARVARSTGSLPWPLVVWATTQLAVIVAWAVVDPESMQSLLSAVL